MLDTVTFTTPLVQSQMFVKLSKLLLPISFCLKKHLAFLYKSIQYFFMKAFSIFLSLNPDQSCSFSELRYSLDTFNASR